MTLTLPLETSGTFSLFHYNLGSLVSLCLLVHSSLVLCIHFSFSLRSLNVVMFKVSDLPFTIHSRLETIVSQSLYFYLVTSVHDLASWTSEPKRSHEASMPLSSHHQISQPNWISSVPTAPPLYSIDVYPSPQTKTSSSTFSSDLIGSNSLRDFCSTCFHSFPT